MGMYSGEDVNNALTYIQGCYLHIFSILSSEAIHGSSFLSTTFFHFQIKFHNQNYTHAHYAVLTDSLMSLQPFTVQTNTYK